MKKYKLGDILELQRGYDLTSAEMKNADVPVAGSNGVIGYHDVAKCITPCITVGRSGSVGKVHFYKNPVWVHNTALYVSNFKGNDPKYLYYLLSVLKLDVLCGSSVVPSLNRNVVYPMEVLFCSDISLQKKISSILSAIDDRIENLRAQNRVLEQTAKTIYDYTFLQCAGHQTTYNKTLNRNIPIIWNVKTIGEILDKVPATTKVKTNLYQQNGKYPIIDQSTNFIAGYTDNESAVIKKTPAVFFGDHTRIVKMINFDFARGADGTQILYSKERAVDPFYLYFAVKAIDLSNMGYARHFKFLKDKPIAIPDKNTSDSFEKTIRPLFDKILINTKQIETLTTQRNTLLPLLMNGQIEAC